MYKVTYNEIKLRKKSHVTGSCEGNHLDFLCVFIVPLYFYRYAKIEKANEIVFIWIIFW